MCRDWLACENKKNMEWVLRRTKEKTIIMKRESVNDKRTLASGQRAGPSAVSQARGVAGTDKRVAHVASIHRHITRSPKDGADGSVRGGSQVCCARKSLM